MVLNSDKHVRMCVKCVLERERWPCVFGVNLSMFVPFTLCSLISLIGGQRCERAKSLDKREWGTGDGCGGCNFKNMIHTAFFKLVFLFLDALLTGAPCCGVCITIVLSYIVSRNSTSLALVLQAEAFFHTTCTLLSMTTIHCLFDARMLPASL